jgi:hypothetical protein
LIGGVLGGMVGGGVALAVATSQFEAAHPIEAVERAKTMTLVSAGIAVLGAVGGLVVGSWEPEC